MGNSFWAAFGIFAVLSLGTLYKLLTIKPIMRVDKKSIRFYRSGIEIKWNNFKSAAVEEIAYDDGDSKPFLILKYYQPNKAALQQLDLPLTALHDKTGEQIIEAIRFYKP